MPWRIWARLLSWNFAPFDSSRRKIGFPGKKGVDLEPGRRRDAQQIFRLPRILGGGCTRSSVPIPIYAALDHMSG